MLRSVVAGAWIFVIGCTPLDDLSGYSSGAPVSPDPEGSLAGIGAGGTGRGAPLDAGNALGSGEDGRPTMVDQPNSFAPVAPAGDASRPEPDSPAVTVARFVRIVADADVSRSPYSSAAELNVLDRAGMVLDSAGWIATADSAESVFVGGAPPAFAVDGDPSTMWHTPWSDPAVRTSHPHFLQVDLGAPRTIGGFSYLPRQDASNDGSITDYRFFVSEDGVEWGEPLVRGRFDASKAAHEVLLEP